MKRFVNLPTIVAVSWAGLLLAAEPTIPNLAERNELWPRKVTATTEISVPVVVQGKVVGKATVPAGSVLPLIKVEGDKVVLDFNGVPTVTDANHTDLMARAAQKLQLLDRRNNAIATAAVLPATSNGSAAATNTAPTAPAPAVAGRVAKALSGSLFHLKNNNLDNLPDANLAGVKFYAVYFSASWCGPCRRFTPSLVKFYNEIKPKHPEFEVIFASNDRTDADMLKYMQTDAMPWPALKPGVANAKPLIGGLAGNGIPCLVLVDQDGKVLSHSFEGSSYVGPGKVMRDIAVKLGEAK